MNADLGELREPMLSAKPPKGDVNKLLKELRFPKLGSPKMDGWRGMVWNGRLYARSLKLVPNAFAQSILGSPEFDGLDGELIVGNPNDFNAMQQTQSGMSTQSGKPNFRFYVFDDIIHKGVFEARLAHACERVRHDITGYVKPVPHELIRNLDELLEYEDRVVGELKFEGVMLRDPRGVYKHGRSTLVDQGLVAVKRFVDFEAKIIGVKEQLENTNVAMVNERGRTQRSGAKAGKVGKGTFGGFVCETLPGFEDVGIFPGVEFSVGGGVELTANLRADIWENRDKYPGRIAKCSGFPVGTKDKPRHPKLRIKDMKFLGIRSPIDMS